VPPKIVELRLKNGARVLLVERHDLPIVSVRVASSAGAGDLAWAPPGAVSLTASMLEQGTLNRSALQISEAYDALGASHSTWAQWDSFGVSVKVMSENLDAALALEADVVAHPAFPKDELDRVRARKRAAAEQEKNNPGAMMSNATAVALFGRKSTYGHSLSGDPADLEKIERDDLQRVHAVLFDPKTSAILVAGDVTAAALLPKLEAAFGSWSAPVAPPLASHAALRVGPPKAPAGEPPRLVFVDRPGAVQSVVRLAEVGISDSAPDRDAVSVMNTILGGMFSSRINMNLREEHAYSYGAGSRFDERHGRGPFVAGGSVKSDATAASVREMFREVWRIEDELVKDDELAGAKESLKLGLPGQFESVESLTDALAGLVVHKRPLDEYATFPARIDKVTAEDVRKAAKAHLHSRTMTVVVVGDRAHLEATFEPLHLGRSVLLDAYGNPVVGAP
jgi:predicted Zn-dependent peptidase